MSTSEQEYLDWFYHTVRQSHKDKTGFERDMANLFQQERGLTCPFYIPEEKKDA